MSDRPLSRTHQLIALCMLVAAVVTIDLAIAGTLTGARSPGGFNSLPVKASQPAGSELCMGGGNTILSKRRQQVPKPRDRVPKFRCLNSHHRNDGRLPA